ncbi:outer membrane beta-barrel protein [Tamlana crocina]
MTKHLLLFFGLFSVFGFSQEFSISGQVKDVNNQPVSYANVVLVTIENTDPATGTITNGEGSFLIEHITPGKYLLKIRFLGFSEYSKEIQVDGDINLKTIMLQENLEELKGVTVIAKRPTVTRLVDRLVFNVENSTLSNNNALDVLKHTPGVIVSDNSISVKMSVPVVYINDRRVHLSITEVQQLLEGTSATNIKSIEVITNPPAKYEAEGGSVLNIVTSKNLVSGYNGSVFGNYKQGSEYPKYSLGTSHFFKTKKLNTYFNYSISPRKDYRNIDEFVNFIENEQTVTSWATDYRRTRKSANHNINTNIEYQFDERNSLGFTTNMLISPREHSKTYVNSNTEVFDNNRELDSSFTTENRLVEETFNLAFTLDYLHKFKKEGEKLSANAHLTDYDFSNFQNVDTDYLFPNGSLIRKNRFQTFTSKRIKLHTGQVDYELPLANSGVFQTGAKISVIHSENILTQYGYENGERFEDVQNSDTFLYDEHNYAVYSSYAKDWNKWSLKLGLRAELTDVESSSISTNSDFNNNYIKFFPTFHVMHNVDENNEIYFNYNRRIFRPRYGQLNPFKFFMNDNTYITGDPNLKPQIDDSFTLGYTLNNAYTFELYYRYENNPAIEIVFQDNDENLLMLINTNIDRSISYGLDFTTYKQLTKCWSIYALSSVFHYDNQFYALESNNALQNIDSWSFYGHLINYFSLLKDKSLTTDLSLMYISPIANGASKISNRFGFDINLRKTFWENRASMSVGVTDIFNTQNFNETTKYLNQDIFLQSRLENRLFTFGFNYKFGNYKLKNGHKEIDSNERDRLNGVDK